MLLTIILLPIIGIFILSFIDKTNILFIRNFALFWSLIILNICFLLLFFYNPNANTFQFIEYYDWLKIININLLFGIDGLSLSLTQLTALLIPTCIMLCWNKSLIHKTREYIIAFFLLESILFGVFFSLDLIVFYLLFEAVLIPMFLIVGIYGSRQRRIRSAYLLFLYTLFSSLFMFLSILYIYFSFGTTDYLILKTVNFGFVIEKLCWIAFFLSFAVKMPLVPFHIWLPEAHCEAPTSGSVILAGILLKLGGFGFLRYSIGLFSDASAYFSPFIYIICILGSVLLMISHGIVSGALFLCIGILYERHHTRLIKYYSGLLITMPIYACFFMLFTMANIGLPGTNSFIGEFLIILGCFVFNSYLGLFAASGMLLGGAYSLWLLNRILFGNIKVLSINTYSDITRIEFYYLLPYAILTVLLGIYPELIITNFYIV